MKIEKIDIVNDGFVSCHSGFYFSADTLEETRKYSFSNGINKLYGEIDSGIWAISYLLSMYTCKPKDFRLFGKTEAVVDDKIISLRELSRYSCYMDNIYPLFSNKKSVRKMVEKGIRQNKLNYSAEEIRDVFCIHPERFEWPLTGVGNEIFKAMAAIGYCFGKEIYCFPWLSKKRFEYYHGNMTYVLETLEKMEKIVIVPIGE